MSSDKSDSFQMVICSKIAAKISIGRYTDDVRPTVIDRLYFSILYSSSMLAGAGMALRSMGFWRWVLIFPLLSGVLVGLVTTMKSAMMLPGVFFLSGYLAMKVVFDQKIKVSAVVVLRIIGSVVLGLFLFLVMFLARYYFESGVTWGVIWNKISVYLFGHLSAVSAWVDFAPIWNQSLQLGKYTFAGIYALFGLGERVQGLYEDRYYFGIYGGESNVFTVFRGLIE